MDSDQPLETPREKTVFSKQPVATRGLQILFQCFLLVNYLAVLLLFAIVIGVCIRRSLPFIRHIGFKGALLGSVWNQANASGPSFGMLSLVAGTFYIGLLAMAIAGPVAVACALYISDRAGPKARKILLIAIEALAWIPTVILGLVGMAAIGPLISAIFGGKGAYSALTASLTLAIMVTPTVVFHSLEALSSVPRKYGETALALGGDWWIALTKVRMPAARLGVVGAILLGFGRVIGETMIVLMVSGNNFAMPSGALDSIGAMTSALALGFGSAGGRSMNYSALAFLGLLLFGFALIVNHLGDIILTRQRRLWGE